MCLLNTTKELFGSLLKIIRTYLNLFGFKFWPHINKVGLPVKPFGGCLQIGSVKSLKRAVKCQDELRPDDRRTFGRFVHLFNLHDFSRLKI